MRTVLLSLISATLLVTGCSQSRRQTAVSIKPSFPQDQQLALAYKMHSTAKLDTFFQRWAAETPLLSQSAIAQLSDTLQAVYAVFQAFYTPRDLGRLGGSEFGNDIYTHVHYVLLQDRIFYGCMDTVDPNADQEPVHLDSIVDFRPAVSFDTPKTVVLTPAYDTLLNQFLGNTYRPFGQGDIMSPASSKGESTNREKFLDNAVRIWYGHWGGYWQLHSYPYATDIVFDRHFQTALVNFRMIYQGGYALFRKQYGQWTLVEGKLTWIE